jgi:hypothetical protein
MTAWFFFVAEGEADLTYPRGGIIMSVYLK